MAAFSNQGGTWKEVKAISANNGGVWTPVKKAFVNNGGTWQQFYGNHTFTLYSLGLNQNLLPAGNRGLWVDGAHTFTSSRSYSLIQFDKYGNVLSNVVYDVFSDSGNANTVNGDAMAAALNAMPSGRLFAICTYDEPQTSRLESNLLTAMQNVGATSALYGSGNSNFGYRSAYLLLGQVGRAAYVEKQRGVTITQADSSQGDYNAALEFTFGITDNAFVNITEVVGN
jgi:hypothetical protein